jgi:molybdate transport system substrate-binding protein
MRLQSVSARMSGVSVISAIGMRDVIADIKGDFAAASGHSLDATATETGEIQRRVLAGEPFDVIVVPREAAEMLTNAGRMASGAVPLVQVNFGLAVRADAPPPDTRTPKALRRTFLAAERVLITDPATGGISGVHLMTVLDALGIAEAMRDRLVPLRGGGSHAARVVNREGDLAVQAEHEIRAVAGAAFVPYPEEFRRRVVFVAGLGTASVNPAAGRRFIAFMRGPEAAAAIMARGLTPA